MNRLVVGLIRPPDTAASVEYRDDLIEIADDDLANDLRRDTPIRFNEKANRMVAEFRAMIEEAADELWIPVSVYEYQAHEFSGPLEMFGEDRRRDFLNNDLLAALDPSPTQCAAMAEGTQN